MIPEIGHFFLILALCIACLQCITPYLASLFQKKLTSNSLLDVISSITKTSAYVQSLLVLLSFTCLLYAFVVNDFSVAYVVENSYSSLPLFYRFAGIWGGHEGSMLLWVSVLSIWTIAVAKLTKTLPSLVSTRVLSILAMISMGFLLFILITSNPFVRLIPYPIEGQDLNPLLQDPGLVSHPPMLYMGYVGFSVVFAFAMAALINGQFNQTWARWMKPWALAAWCFLTLGIILGSWWAYRVLGWGGWWFWDPVENASLMPWLAGTALIHSLILTEKREGLKSWTLLLAIGTFSFSLIGTFLVRSGILTSVHAFAMDPRRGSYILNFILIVMGGALALYVARIHKIQRDTTYNFFSKETLIVLNNILLLVILATVMLGTLYPLVLEILNLGKISVGPPYFNMVCIPLILILMFLMGIGPLCEWHYISKSKLFYKTRWLIIISVVIACLIPSVITREFHLTLFLGLFLATWIILTAFKSFKDTLLKANKHWLKISGSQYGMLAAHIGLAICAIGISVSSQYSLTRELAMQIGDKVQLYNYRIEFQKMTMRQQDNFLANSGNFIIYQKNHLINTIYPEKRYYQANELANSVPGIEINLFHDIYVVLGEALNDNTWSVRIYYKPFIRWIWMGGLLMVLGGILGLVFQVKWIRALKR
ncbi:MAG: heme lyase CcmF/NrfE family subunit [Gammaproteobacteria bacterium]